MTSKPHSLPVNKWKWSALGTPPPTKSPMSIKTKALIQVPIMTLVGWIMFHYFHHRVVPVIVWSLAGLVLVGGLFLPPLFHAFEKFGAFLAKWVAIMLNWVLLVPFFYLCFVPGRLILKLQGIDPMDRTYPDPRPSLWIPRKPVASMEQYRKQH
jgi:hypothetical protein